jgi:hypothetical protein
MDRRSTFPKTLPLEHATVFHCGVMQSFDSDSQIGKMCVAVCRLTLNTPPFPSPSAQKLCGQREYAKDRRSSSRQTQEQGMRISA